MRRVAASLAFLALVATAHAAPVPVSPRTVEASPVSLAFDAAGDGLASWRGLSGTADASRPFHALAARTPAGEWQAPHVMARSVLTHDVVVYGNDFMALVTEREQPAGKAHTRSLITLSFGTLAPLDLGPTKIIDRGPVRHVAYDGPRPTRFAPVVGASNTGSVVVAWERAGSGIWALSGERRRLLGPFGHAPALNLAADGSGLLAWRRGSRILGRVRDVAGAWGPIEVIARVGRYSELAPVSIAGADGRFAVALTEITRSLHGVHWRSTLHTRNGGWHAKTLETKTFVPTGSTAYVTDNLRTLVTMTSDGRFHAAWPGLLGPTAAVDDIAAGAGGWSVSWFDGATKLADMGSQTTTTLSTGRSAVGSQVAYDPQTGRPVVIWSQDNQIVSST